MNLLWLPLFSSEPDVKRKKLMISLPQNRTLKDSIFKPLYIIGEWEEPGKKTKRLTIAIVLPSGVNRSDFTLQILEGGMSLQISVKWPSPLVDLELLHQKWLKDQATVFTM